MEDKFGKLRKAKEGTLESDSNTEVESVPTVAVDIQKEEAMESADMKEFKKAKLLNIVLLAMVFVMLSLFMFLFFTDRLVVGVENPFCKGSDVESEQVQSDDTPVVESVDVQKADTFVNSRELYDANGTFLGFKELKIEMDRERELFNMQVTLPYGETVVSGAFVEKGSDLYFTFSGVDLRLEDQIKLQFKYLNEEKTQIQFVSGEFGASLPEVGDIFNLAVY